MGRRKEQYFYQRNKTIDTIHVSSISLKTGFDYQANQLYTGKVDENLILYIWSLADNKSGKIDSGCKMKDKKIIIIIILLLLFLLLLIFLRKRGLVRNWRRELKRSWPATEPTPQVSPSVTVSPSPQRQTPVPTPIPSPSPKPTTDQILILEADFNNYLAQGVVQQPSRENPYTSATIDFQEEVGWLNMNFEKGQTLTAEVFITDEGRSLDLRNVKVTGAEGFEETFIQTASDLIREGLDNFVDRLGQSVQIEELKIQSEGLLVYYRSLL